MARDVPHILKREDSQLLFEKLFAFSPDAIVVVDREGRIKEANPQVERLFGYASSLLIGNAIEILIPERFRTAHPVHRADFNKQPHMRPMGVGLELQGRRKDGTEFPVDIMLSPVETEDGSIVLAVIRDTTQRKRAEEALRQSEERLRSLVEGVKDHAIFMLSPEGLIASWNPGAERIKGYRADEIVGRHFSCFYTQEDIERGKPEYALRIAAAQGRFEDETWRIRKDGSRFWADVVITALKDSAGKITGYAKVTRDFTERKKSQDALLLELSSALLSSLDIQKLLSAIASSIQQVVPHDYSSLCLYDQATGELQEHILTGVQAPSSTPLSLSVENSTAGRVFTSRERLVFNSFEGREHDLSGAERMAALGLKSACWLPVVHGERPLGTLIVASRREELFVDHHLEMLSQIAMQVGTAVDNALAFSRIKEMSDKLAQEKRYLEEELKTEHSFEEIIGDSPELKSVLKQVETVAATDATVLILGETGTGKELIARAIHGLSSRHERSIVKLNCAAIPSGLLESELFGHEKGAFTGAISQKLGRLELANHGTLFLDEIGDLPVELQPKILRALQEKEIERLGGSRTIAVDVRLIAATNRNLEQMVADKQFRSDLYYRLRVFPLALPPLRERREDIPLLVRYFVDHHSRRMDRRITTIPDKVMQALIRWKWPGNIRELENFIERAVILSNGPELKAPISELNMEEDVTAQKDSNLDDVERQHILSVLRETKGLIGSPNGAAVRLGLKRTTLNSKLKKFGITRRDYM
jgi:formate hydrogenlyase transcriptional activator